jgi:uncharacterized protein involved in outer membrane biogenesis
VIKRLFRWAIYLFIILVVLVVAGILLLDTIAREVTANRIRSETGMGVKIGKMSVGLLNPTVTIENFKLYNTAEFGGSQCVDIPELHIEYDAQAARAGKLHFKLVRFNMAEVDIIQDKKGRTNFDHLQKNPAVVVSKTNNTVTTKNGTFKFTGIDTLNLTLQKAHISTESPRQERDVNFGIKNQVFHNIKSESDLLGVAAVVSLRVGSLNTTGSSLDGMLKQLLR